jgi:hypothetical protein
MFTLGKDLARSYGRGLIIWIVAAVIVIPLWCVLILVPLYLVTTLNLSPWLLAISAALMLLMLLGGGATAIGLTIYRRKRGLDAAFTPLGLQGSPYNSFFRQYHGAVQERQVDVWLYRGPVLDMEISTPLQTRLGVTGPHSDTRLFSTLLNKPPLAFSDPALSSLTVYALDEAWARSLLDNPHAVELLCALTSTTDQFSRQQVILRPGTFRLQLAGNRRLLKFDLPTPEQARAWFEELLRLARVAEHIAAPQITDTESSTEQFARRLRQRNPYMAVWVGLGTLVGLLACGAVIFAAVMLFTAGQ